MNWSMVTPIVSLIAGFAVSFYYYRRAQQLQNFIRDAGNTVDQQNKQLSHSKSVITRLEIEITNLKAECHQSRSETLKASTRAAEFETAMQRAESNFNRKWTNLEAQRDHILNQFETLQSEKEQNQLKDSTQSEIIRTLTDENRRLKSERDHAKRDALQESKTEFTNLQLKVTQLEKELATYKARPEVDPKAIDALKRRALHNEQLFHSMKSLRDMADERSANWEVALKRMATWILSESSLAVPQDPILNQSIGPLVGEALERIGQSILNALPAEELAAERQMMRSAEH